MRRAVAAAWLALALHGAAGSSSADEPAPATHDSDTFRSATAYAPPLTGIVIDGRLGDWPDNLPWYPLRNVHDTASAMLFDAPDAGDAGDLSARFRVGFDPDEHLIYVAVEVRDDAHVVGTEPGTTDAVLVSVSPRDPSAPVEPAEADEEVAATDMDPRPPATPVPTALRYAGVAGRGSYAHGENPGLLGLPQQRTRTRFAYSREDGMTVYEWAVECFDRYPERMTDLGATARLGLDVAVVDQDREAPPPAAAPPAPRAAAVALPRLGWGPAWREAGDDTTGRLVLIDSADELHELAGEVRRAGDAAPLAGVVVEARDEAAAGCAVTDAEGRFMLRLPAGRYSVAPAPMQGEAAPAVEIAVGSDASPPVTLTLAPTPLPEALLRAGEAYAALSSYQDQASLQLNDSAAPLPLPPMPLAIAWAAPDRLRIATRLAGAGEMAVVSDGSEIACVLRRGQPFWRAPLEGALTAAALGPALEKLKGRGRESGQPQLLARLLVYRLVLSRDPLRELRRGLVSATELGEASVEGEPCTVVEIVKPAAWMEPAAALSPAGPATLTVQLSISQRDGLIRKVSYQLPAGVAGAGNADAADPAAPAQTVSCIVTHRQVRVDHAIDPAVFTLPPAAAQGDPTPAE